MTFNHSDRRRNYYLQLKVLKEHKSFNFFLHYNIGFTLSTRSSQWAMISAERVEWTHLATHLQFIFFHYIFVFLNFCSE